MNENIFDELENVHIHPKKTIHVALTSREYIKELEDKLEKAKQALKNIRHEYYWDEFKGFLHKENCVGCYAEKILKELE